MAFEGFDEGLATTSKGRLFYLHRKGSTLPVIFLHGIGASLKTWSKLIPYLPKELDVYLLDFLGHGRSDAPEIDYDVMTQVNALEEMIGEIGIKVPILFGHSYGGWVAILYATMHSTKSLIIEDCAGVGSQVENLTASGAKSEYRQNLISGSIKIGANERVIRSIISNSDKYLLNKDILLKLKENVLLIWGEDDDLVDLSYGKEMESGITNSELIIIPKAGHVPHITKPEDVARALANFL